MILALTEENEPIFITFSQKRFKGTKLEKFSDPIANKTLLTTESNREMGEKDPSYLLNIDEELR